jgi:UDP-N-acetylglucosamine transferase subunit ALG13
MPPVERPRLFVTLGTIHPYRFDALVDAICATGLADGRTVWQLGATTRRALPGTVLSQMGAAEFEECARNADVVITHAGVGTIMHLLEMNIFPVVVPRRAARNEHIDDHQAQIAGLLARRSIGVVREADELDAGSIVEASAASVRNIGTGAVSVHR